VIGLDGSRIAAVIRKELRDYRRKRSIVVGMAILPCFFLVEPVVAIFVVSAATSGTDQFVVFPLLYLLLIPVFTPPTLAAYTIAGEREQGTLEPLLTTPLRQQEFIVGKAAAVMIPTLALSYGLFAIFLICVRLFARPVESQAVFHQPGLLIAMVILTPLLASWSIWVGMAASVRANEVRVAQQLGMLGGLPAIALILLISLGTLTPDLAFGIKFGVILLLVDVAALRVVSRLFDRERLVTGSKASRS
jgi:ABC-type transport system involved in multi-copper enzyme maturation permease subunit